jgi:phage gp46-like protein
VASYDGDLMLYGTPDGGEINVQDGQPDMDAGLATAVYLSLYSGDWWGNALAAKAERTVASIEDKQGLLTNAARLDVEAAARVALQWLVDEGIASAVDVAATLPAVGWLQLAVTVTEPNADPTVLRYKINWAAQRAAMGVA